MPELPEVEYAARHLRAWLGGRRVLRAQAEDTRIIRPSTPAQVARALGGRRLEHLERRAKYLLFTFDGGQGALGHLGMTGKWVRRRPEEEVAHSRLRLYLDDGSVLHYVDPRLFGQFSLHPADELSRLRPIAALGPDPLRDGLTPQVLGQRLARTRRPVKLALMDQGLVAGLGNILAAEALYRAQLDPRRPADRLTPAELKALTRAIHAAIAHTLDSEAEPGELAYVEEGGENPFLVYGRPGQRCRRCGKPFASFTQGGRTTWWCPGCQR